MCKLIMSGICCIIAILTFANLLSGNVAICLCIAALLWGFGSDDVRKK